MCIIIYNEKGAAYNPEKLETAYDNNPHGVGIMWIENEQIRTVRGLLGKKQTMDLLREFEGIPHAIHLRWKTRGKIVRDMCHPFRVSAKSLDQRVFYMHNGTFMKVKTTTEQSDSFAFAKTLRTVTEKQGTDILFNESYLAGLEAEVESWNRMLFMRDDGKVSLVNPSKWTQENGIWYSNTYSFLKDYRKPAYMTTTRKSYSYGNGYGTVLGASSQNSSAQKSVTPSSTGDKENDSKRIINGKTFRRGRDGVWRIDSSTMIPPPIEKKSISSAPKSSPTEPAWWREEMRKKALTECAAKKSGGYITVKGRMYFLDDNGVFHEVIEAKDGTTNLIPGNPPTNDSDISEIDPIKAGRLSRKAAKRARREAARAKQKSRLENRRVASAQASQTKFDFTARASNSSVQKTFFLPEFEGNVYLADLETPSVASAQSTESSVRTLPNITLPSVPLLPASCQIEDEELSRLEIELSKL